MIFLKWLGLTLLDYLFLLPPALYAWMFTDVSWWMWLSPFYTIAVVGSLFTRNGWGIWKFIGTYDNPPQGDRGWISHRGWFSGEIDGWKGYLNRVGWLFRNPLYQFSKFASVPFSEASMLFCSGDSDISDKYKKPGQYWATLYNKQDKLIAFEFYAVKPWPFKVFGREICLRARLGWKIHTDKFVKLGFAPLADTCNPFDGYGDQ